MDITKIKSSINKYLRNIQRDLVIDQALLYGSFARGNATANSDVDLLILSRNFAKMDEDKRLEFLYRKSVGFPYNLHVYGLTPHEYQSASPLTSLGAVKSEVMAIL